jgi:hypothetical protein
MPPQLLAIIYAPSGYPSLDAALAQEPSATRVVVAFCGVELLGTLSGAPAATPYGPDRVHDLLEDFESLTLAAEMEKASGRPFLSTNRWCLVPALPQSAELDR